MTMAGYEVQTTMDAVVDDVLPDDAAFLGEIRSKLFVYVITARPDAFFAAQCRAKTYGI